MTLWRRRNIISMSPALTLRGLQTNMHAINVAHHHCRQQRCSGGKGQISLNNKKMHGSLAIANLFRGKMFSEIFGALKMSRRRATRLCMGLDIHANMYVYVYICFGGASCLHKRFAWMTAIC